MFHTERVNASKFYYYHISQGDTNIKASNPFNQRKWILKTHCSEGHTDNKLLLNVIVINMLISKDKQVNVTLVSL